MLRMVFTKIILIPVICGVLWFAGFMVFVSMLPLIPEDQTTPTDAIVVWTGGPHRLATGIELLRQGLADKLLISGVSSSHNSKIGLIRRVCAKSSCEDELQPFLERITLGYEAKTTIGNAIETANWSAANQVRSIRLVTTSMHIPRSHLEIRRYLPECKFIYHPVDLAYFDHRKWWIDQDVFIKIAREYSKFIVVACGGTSSAPEQMKESKEEL